MISETEVQAAAALVNELVGKPWRLGAQGPDAFDCWSLCRHVVRTLAGRDLPDWTRPTEASFPALRATFQAACNEHGWQSVEKPSHLCVGLLAPVQGAVHAGVFLKLGVGQLLHCDERYGVVCEELQVVRARGFQRQRWFAP